MHANGRSPAAREMDTRAADPRSIEALTHARLVKHVDSIKATLTRVREDDLIKPRHLKWFIDRAVSELELLYQELVIREKQIALSNEYKEPLSEVSIPRAI